MLPPCIEPSCCPNSSTSTGSRTSEFTLALTAFGGCCTLSGDEFYWLGGLETDSSGVETADTGGVTGVDTCAETGDGMLHGRLEITRNLRFFASRCKCRRWCSCRCSRRC